MFTRVILAKAGAAALAGMLALSSTAQAQSAGPYTSRGYDRYAYDPCRRDANQRGTAGGLIGGGIGAVIGSNAAARNARTEGAILGGLLGAIAGGVVGHKTAACNAQGRVGSSGYPTSTADDRYGRDDHYARRDDDPRADGRRAEEEADVASRDRFEGRSGNSRDTNACELAESPVRMPDGTAQTRFVRVCRDASGHYAVVD